MEEEEEEEYETADSGVSEQSSTTSSSTDSLTLNRKRKQQGAGQDNASSSGAVKGRLLFFPLFLHKKTSALFVNLSLKEFPTIQIQCMMNARLFARMLSILYHPGPWAKTIDC